MKKTLCNNKGYTLIEVVIALGVLGFGILAMFAMQVTSIKGNANANKITQETIWGADGLEKALVYSYEDLLEITSANQPLSGSALYLTNVVDRNKYDILWTVTKDKPLADMATITVKVNNRIDGKQVTLRYIKADPYAF